MTLAVQRVHTDNGSHIEPPLEGWWTDLDKLRWKLAVSLHDAHLPPDVATVEPADLRVDGRKIPDVYDVRYRSVTGLVNGSHGAGDFHDTWALINGITLGFQIAHGGARGTA